MSQDSDLIAESYAEALKTIFATFLTNTIAAAASPDPDQQRKAAEQDFQNGIRMARQVRDRAIQLLSPAQIA